MATKDYLITLRKAAQAVLDSGSSEGCDGLTVVDAAAFQNLEDAMRKTEPARKPRFRIDKDARLYVIPLKGGGFSCFGFDNAYNEAARLAQWLPYDICGRVAPSKANIGTLAGYREYKELLKIARVYCETNKVRCPVDLTPQLVGLEGKRVEVEDMSGEKRRFIVGKSTGWMPCHLEISRRGSHGGPAAEREYKTVREVQ